MDQPKYRANELRVSLNVAYPIEILPYRIRANGLMVQSLATNLALFFGQYVNPIGIDNAGWHFYFLYEALLVVQVVTVWFTFIETKGATLEEISRTFDGEDAVEEVKALAVEKKVADQADEVEDVQVSEERAKDV
jgi:MFS family permease